MTENTLGARVRTIRKEKQLTQAKLSDLTGVCQAVIQKIENGRSLHPRCIAPLSNALGVNPAWLQFGPEYAAMSPPA